MTITSSRRLALPNHACGSHSGENMPAHTPKTARNTASRISLSSNSAPPNPQTRPNAPLMSQSHQLTVTLIATEPMPLATTASELTPVSVSGETVNCVDTMVLPVATPMLLWPWVRA
jgi:hypothetical protein